ncbi:uncharacterized protein LOC107858777 [Capsicum annuum]|uniref:uncharacterized protein LOC107858777 n=1 Tax=Capsicum annuum TaxID=4072 RepID=UPI0007BF12B0|nr:uncharacterized protein LOC107858777 [Capsicum annuum]
MLFKLRCGGISNLARGFRFAARKKTPSLAFRWVKPDLHRVKSSDPSPKGTVLCWYTEDIHHYTGLDKGKWKRKLIIWLEGQNLYIFDQYTVLYSLYIHKRAAAGKLIYSQYTAGYTLQKWTKSPRRIGPKFG